MIAVTSALVGMLPIVGHAISYDYDADCRGLKLVAATGVPLQSQHTYQFNGSCLLTRVEHDHSKGPDVEQVPARASATWDSKAQELVESFQLLAPITFWTYQITDQPVSSRFRCDADPLVTTKAACIKLNHQNLSGYHPFSWPAQKNRPILRGKTTLAQATELSKQQPVSPPSDVKVARAAAAAMANRQESAARSAPLTTVQVAKAAAAAIPQMFTVEAEELVANGKAVVNGGQLVARPVVDGSGSQLFWHGGAVGAVLDLKIDVPAASRYAVELYFTRGPEYANLQIEVDGNSSPVSFSGFAPSVMAPAPVQAGTFSLQPGTRNVSFMINGKYQDATGFIVGIDRLVFYPAGPP
jgi:hypothetical protein